ncbi:MAG: Holliday junction resolvase RuvX, partial [Endomicrobium sp.]|nr:Holliday junction resolvase RuvX [Endomicrobium sp.]
MDDNMQNISRLIGIDYGSKNIGIAISDATLTIASPFCIIKNFSLKRSALEILEISKKNNVSMLILGLPINMNGSLGEMSKVVYKFIDTIKCFSNIAIETV